MATCCHGCCNASCDLVFDRAAPVTAIIQAAVCGVPRAALHLHGLRLLLVTLFGCCAAACLLLLGPCYLKALFCMGEAPAYKATELL